VQIFFVLHSNHPRELDSDVIASLKKIQRLGIPILNQTVLLKGVNDSLSTLKELFEKLVNAGFLPYYLHQLDPIEGATHFAAQEPQGQQLLQQLTAQLSGYALPKFVKEIAGSSSKTLLY
jgi:L-lysine 2,3-aminomutase